MGAETKTGADPEVAPYLFPLEMLAARVYHNDYRQADNGASSLADEGTSGVSREKFQTLPTSVENPTST